jgi:hypothetical protein
MQLIQYGKTVAITEARLLSRSWVFRFLVTLVLGSLVFFNIGLFFTGKETNAWMLKNIPSTIPYINILFLTVVECLIIMFGAVDALMREYHQNTAPSLHSRCYTNLGYLTGKAVGIMIPCLILNLIVTILVLMMNVYLEDAEVVWQAYILYPLALSIPTLLFVTGLSLAVTASVRSLPLTLFILLGIFILPFFYYDGITVRLFDFAGMHLPLMYSSIVGTDNLKSILFQRGFFAFLGLGGIPVAALLFRRLPQSPRSRRLSAGLVIGFLSVSVIFGTLYLDDTHEGIRLRDRIRALNEDYVTKPRTRLSKCDLKIVHDGSKFDVTATLTLENRRTEPLGSLCFSLNPGFTVRSVSMNGADLPFARNTQILDVTLPSPLEPGSTTVLFVIYDGRMDNDACYPDIAEEERIRANRFFACVIPRRYGFMTNNYVLLTPECQWYPTPGIPYGLVLETYERDFTEFTMEIRTRDELIVVSQGVVEKTGAGSFTAKTDTKLPGLTLAVGRYEEKSVEVDSIEVALYYLPGHDFFTQSIPADFDLTGLLSNIKKSTGNRMGMDYPFPRFFLLESPVQFHAYDRPLRTWTEVVQPELSIMPEKGFYMQEFDIAGMIARFESRGRKVDYVFIINNIIQLIISDTRAEQDRQIRSVVKDVGLPPWYFNLTLDWIKHYPGTDRYQPTYTVSAQFCPFVASFESERCPMLNTVIEYNLKYGMDLETGTNLLLNRLNYGLLDDEIACAELERNTFQHYIETCHDPELLKKILRVKVNYLFGLLSATGDSDDPSAFFKQFIQKHTFDIISYSQLADAIRDETGFDLDTVMDSWYRETRLPRFVIDNASITEILVNDHICYQNRFTVTNTEPVPGLIQFNFGDQFDTQAGYYKERTFRNVAVDAHQSKEISFITESLITEVGINTVVAQNLPLKFGQTLGSLSKDEHLAPFDGERIVPYTPQQLEPGVIVVDNLDGGFEILSEPDDIDDNAGYYRIGMIAGDFIPPLVATPPKRWGKAVFTGSFGSKSTAFYTRSGKGDGQVIWRANIPEAGMYNLEYYLVDFNISEYAQQFSKYGPQLQLGEYNLTITYAGGENTISFLPQKSQPGWQFMGTFDLKPGMATVTLSNKSDGTLIYADAIRWVKK